jgi:hypothetical protein
MKRGRHGSQGQGKPGIAKVNRVGNSLREDGLKTNKRSMPKSVGLQAQATPGVEVSGEPNPERLSIASPPRYPHGLA